MLPKIIQGGMGVHISTPFLASAVSQLDGLGTVSGVAAWLIMTRILQQGDPGRHYRRALSYFPLPEVAQEVLDEYFVPGGITLGTPFKPVPAVTLTPSRSTISTVICANFALVWLAKEGHSAPVSINWLEKMQMAHLYSIYGAMLADVDYVTMGAGIPMQIPGVLDAYAQGRPAEYRVSVSGRPDSTVTMHFDPLEFFGQPVLPLRRPAFLPIVSADALATLMAKKSPGGIQGFVVEGPTAGGHNAPPRGKYTYNAAGEPIYGIRDMPDFGKLRDLSLPFWVGGSCATPAALLEAERVGASGIQVGSIFALSEDSGMDPKFRRAIIRHWYRNQLRVATDVHASPTGFPFKVAQLPGTLSDESTYEARVRICNHHGLVEPHQLPSGDIVYRCPAEPERFFQRKEGILGKTIGARCLCNGLLATAALGDTIEPAIVTLGDDVSFLRWLTTHEDDTYSVVQAMEYLIGAI